MCGNQALFAFSLFQIAVDTQDRPGRHLFIEV